MKIILLLVLLFPFQCNSDQNDENQHYLQDIEILDIRPISDNGIHLVWGATLEEQRLNRTYEVFYGIDQDADFKEPKLTTNELHADVPDLEFCKKYLFAVGIRGKGSEIHPNSSNIRSIGTFMDKFSSPLNLHVDFLPGKEPCLLIKWSASCPNIAAPMGYALQVSTSDGPAVPKMLITIPKSMVVDQSHILPTTYGCLHTFKVTNDVPNALYSEPVTYRTPNFLQPYDIRLAIHPEGAYLLYWKDPYVPLCNGLYFYEVLVFTGKNITSTTSYQIFRVNRPAFVYKGNDTENTFGVHLICNDRSAKSHLSDTVYGNINGDVIYSDSV